MPGDRPGCPLLDDLRFLLGTDAIIAALAFAFIEQRLGHIVARQFTGQLAAMGGGNLQDTRALLGGKHAGIEQRQHHRARMNRVGGRYAQGIALGTKLDNPALPLAPDGDLRRAWRSISDRRER